MAKSTDKQKLKKREKKNIITGVAHVSASFNNTLITITDLQGNVISWSSSGHQGIPDTLTLHACSYLSWLGVQ